MRARAWGGLGVVLAATLVTAPGRAEQAKTPAVAPAKAVEPPAVDAPYDPLGRRDPFRPPRVGAAPGAEGRTPLQRYDVGQLRLVAVIYDTRDPRAVVEDDQGLGYIVDLLAAGRNKTVRGYVGLHRPYFPHGDSALAAAGSGYSPTAYLKDMNVPLSLLDDMNGIEPTRMRVLTKDELAKYRLN